MARHRSHSAEFKRQVAQEFLAGDTLHSLAKRHDIARDREAALRRLKPEPRGQAGLARFPKIPFPVHCNSPICRWRTPAEAEQRAPVEATRQDRADPLEYDRHHTHRAGERRDLASAHTPRHADDQRHLAGIRSKRALSEQTPKS